MCIRGRVHRSTDLCLCQIAHPFFQVSPSLLSNSNPSKPSHPSLSSASISLPSSLQLIPMNMNPILLFQNLPSSKQYHNLYISLKNSNPIVYMTGQNIYISTIVHTNTSTICISMCSCTWCAIAEIYAFHYCSGVGFDGGEM